MSVRSLCLDNYYCYLEIIAWIIMVNSTIAERVIVLLMISLFKSSIFSEDISCYSYTNRRIYFLDQPQRGTKNLQELETTSSCAAI